MLWPIRRRLLATAQVGCALALIPGFTLVAWSIADGPAALRALGIETWLPAGEVRDNSLLVIVPVFLLALVRINRLADCLRSYAISGIGDPLPLAKPLEATCINAQATPITIMWTRSRASRIGLLFGFAVIVGCAVGLAELMQQLGVFGYVASQVGLTFWLLTIALALLALVCALFAFMLLYLAMQGPCGVIGDEYGMSAYSRSGPLKTIAWVDARLIETWRTGSGFTVYRLYAADGHTLSWRVYVSIGSALTSKRGAIDEHLHSAQTILALALARANLTPRTLAADRADPASIKPTNDLIPLSGKQFNATLIGMDSVLIAYAVGAGAYTLIVPSPLAPLAPRVSAIALLVVGLWSFGRLLRRALTLPTILTPAHRPNWQTLASGFGDRMVSIRSHPNRISRIDGGMHAALLLIGSMSGLATLVASLLAGYPVADWWSELSVTMSLSLAALFAILRLRDALAPRTVQLTASVTGLRTTATMSVHWDDITSLRYRLNGKYGFVYQVATKRLQHFQWESGDAYGMATDAIRDPGNDGASRVDADTFAAIVASRTGLTPVQIVAS